MRVGTLVGEDKYGNKYYEDNKQFFGEYNSFFGMTMEVRLEFGLTLFSVMYRELLQSTCKGMTNSIEKGKR